jgi:hypothetical protein
METEMEDKASVAKADSQDEEEESQPVSPRKNANCFSVLFFT